MGVSEEPLGTELPNPAEQIGSGWEPALGCPLHSDTVTQDSLSLLSDGNRQPVLPAPEATRLLLPFLSVRWAGAIGALGSTLGPPGRLLCSPQSPLTDPSRRQLLPSALTSIGAGPTCPLPRLPASPQGEDENGLSGGGWEV